MPGHDERNEHDPTLTSRIALVTGASRHRLCRRARSQRPGRISWWWRGRKAGWKSSTTRLGRTGGSATLVPLGLTDYDGIARLGAALHERHGKPTSSSAMPASLALRRSATSSLSRGTT